MRSPSPGDDRKELRTAFEDPSPSSRLRMTGLWGSRLLRLLTLATACELAMCHDVWTENIRLQDLLSLGNRKRDCRRARDAAKNRYPALPEIHVFTDLGRPHFADNSAGEVE